MKSIRLFRSFLKAKAIVFISKSLGQGRGTSLPGISIEKRYPEVLKELSQGFGEIILISGTNGKTTTRSLLTSIYEANGVQVCSNRGGANLIRGIASSLLLNLGWDLKPKAKVGIFEVEEASLPTLCKHFKADTLILTNVFRDQLDAYGEVNKTVEYFKSALLNLGVKLNGAKLIEKEMLLKVIYNGEDKKLVDLIEDFEVQKLPFGIDIEDHKKPKYEAKADPKNNKNCIKATNLETQNLEIKFDLKIENKTLKIQSKLPGVYNVYNILAAVLASHPSFGKTILEPIANFMPAFGRGERILFKNSEIILFLIKNPAGFDQVLDLLSSNYEAKKLNLAVAINDNIADGRDVSWLWDVDLEKFVKEQKLESLYTAGSRGLDMLTRFQYAGSPVEAGNNLDSFEDLVQNIETAAKPFVVLCTYTALMQFRKLLETKTTLTKFDSTGN